MPTHVGIPGEYQATSQTHNEGYDGFGTFVSLHPESNSRGEGFVATRPRESAAGHEGAYPVTVLPSERSLEVFSAVG
jgi:hypothetical protein